MEPFTSITGENLISPNLNSIKQELVMDARCGSYAPLQKMEDCCQGIYTLRSMSKTGKIWNKILNSIVEDRLL